MFVSFAGKRILRAEVGESREFGLRRLTTILAPAVGASHYAFLPHSDLIIDLIDGLTELLCNMIGHLVAYVGEWLRGQIVLVRLKRANLC